MALYRFKETNDRSGLKEFRTSDPGIMNFVTARQDLFAGNIIGSGKNKMRIDSISVQVFGKPEKDQFSEIGQRLLVGAEILFSVSPENIEEFQLWEKEFWNDITENGYLE